MSKTYGTSGTSDITDTTPSSITSTPNNGNNGMLSRLGEHFGVGIALFALYIIWGSTYLGMRIALDSFPPFIMMGIRFLIAGGLLYIVMRMRGAPHPTRKQWLGAGIVGTFLLVGGNGGVAFAEQWVATGLAAVAVAAVPLWTAFLVGLTGRWPSRIEWIGLGLGFTGVLLLNVGNNVWATPVGAIALLLGPICWTTGSVLSTRVSLPPGLISSAAEMLVGGVATLLIAFITGERITHMPTWNALLAMGFLIIFGSLVAFSAFGYLLRKVRPTLATSYAYVNPIVAVALGVFFDSEHISILGILAMLVILTGVALVSFGKQRS